MAAQNNTNTVITNEPSLRASHCEDEGRSKLKQSVSLIPKLRFKEFEDNWEKKKLGEVAKVITGSTPPTANREYYGGQLMFVSPSDIADSRYIYETKTTITELGFKKGRKVNKGSVLFVCIGSTIGKVAQITVDSLTNQQINALQATKNYSNNFIYSLLEKNGSRIKRLAGVQAVPQINKTDFASLKYYFPQLPEQQKIASFLTAIDSKLQQLNTKKTLLEQYKKGVMQQLFSQKLRFKPAPSGAEGDDDGKDYGDWKEKQYGQIFSFYSTNSLSRDKLNYECGKVKNLHYGDIHTKFSMLFNIKEELVPFINPEVDLSKIKIENYCQEGDLIIADASEDYNDIGKTIELVNLNNEKVLAGLHTFLARPKKNKMHLGFSGYLIQTWKVRKQVMTIAQGTKVLSLSTSRLGRIKLMIPELEEQQKIANYLSALDSKIETITHQIEKTQAFKKGLLQGMFV
ncbi:restriction endonuclease subunit S [Gelidibacter salicanalis]|uniref:Restriction endonuclease subunit S n=1 Tax=Gelidibacter salicanalis TaxID=291193 RepID=A0A5C7AQ75_9FLAO|nr:restriction endonuclease subunit S [Gelidibacter salicanalis]TXE10758.1 restriction endonuclease subunit S [Gelidibacter salicanalis]